MFNLKVSEIRDISVQGLGVIKVCNLELKEDGQKFVVSLWDNAAIYTHCIVGDIVKFTDVTSGWNNNRKIDHIVVRYEDQVQVKYLNS